MKPTILQTAIAIALVSLFGAPRSSAAGTNLAPGVGSRATAVLNAKRAAYDAFARGDDAMGLAKLAAIGAAGFADSSDDLQTIRGLADVAYWLQNAGKVDRAIHVARIAITNATTARGRMPANQRAAAFQIVAELAERTLGDPAQARQAYRSALDLNPNLPNAQRRLDHLQAVEAEAGAKARANEALRQRSSGNPKH